MALDGQPPADPIDSKYHDPEKYDPEEPDLKPVEPINNQYIDPFAHDESSEVKYKTLKWWYVGNSFSLNLVALRTGKLTISLGNVECVWI